MVYQVHKRPQNHLTRSLLWPRGMLSCNLHIMQGLQPGSLWGCVGLAANTWLIPPHLLSPQTVHLRLWLSISLCKVPGTASPPGDSLLSWWLWSILASLEQQWELVLLSCALQNIFCSLGSQERLPADAALSWEHTATQRACTGLWSGCSGLFHFPGRSGSGHWCYAGLGVFSCCP